MEQENELGVKPIKKLLWKLAVPAITAQIVNVLYNVVDRIYIGHIPEVGKLALTGVGVCMPLIMLISAFAMLAGMGGAPRASIMLGRNDAEEAERILGNCAALLILVAVTLTVLFRKAVSFNLWRKQEYDWLRYGLYPHLRLRYDFCAADARSECLHYGAGLCQNQHENHPHRRGDKYHPRSDFYFCAWHGGKGCGIGNGAFAGTFRHMGADLPAGKANHAEIKAEKFPLAGKGYSPLCAAGVKPLCDAVYGKYSEYLL